MTVLNYQVSDPVDDGAWWGSSFGFANNYANLKLGGLSGTARYIFCRWTGVTIPVGVKITSAYISFNFYGSNGTPPACTLSFEDAANPLAVSSWVDGFSRVTTTANISVTGPVSGVWWNTGSIVTIIEELLASYSYAGGAAMQMIINGVASSYYSDQCSCYDANDPDAPVLHIEYAKIAPVAMNQYRRRRTQ